MTIVKKEQGQDDYFTSQQKYSEYSDCFRSCMYRIKKLNLQLLVRTFYQISIVHFPAVSDQ